MGCLAKQGWNFGGSCLDLWAFFVLRACNWMLEAMVQFKEQLLNFNGSTPRNVSRMRKVYSLEYNSVQFKFVGQIIKDLFFRIKQFN